MIKKDHWYWIRYKFTATLTVGKPYSVKEGKATGWCLPYVDRILIEKEDLIEVIAEIPFPNERTE